MKITNDMYKIQKEGLNIPNKRFISLSDLHYGVLMQLFYKGHMDKLFDYIIKSNKNKKIDAILIPGDLIFWISNYQEKDFIKALKRDLENLSFNLSAPIFISYGNHDLPFKEESLTDLDKEKWNLANYIEDRRNGVFVLNNEQIRLDDIVITGFSPSRVAYSPALMPKSALEISKETFDKCNFSFNKSDLNILLSHENKFFTYEQIASSYNSLYEYVTLIIGGHLHDGYMPIWFQKAFKDKLKDNGIWENIPMKIDMCRGAYKVSNNLTSEVILPTENEFTDIYLKENESASIVNRGIAKYSWFLPSTPAMLTIETKDDFSYSLRK